LTTPLAQRSDSSQSLESSVADLLASGHASFLVLFVFLLVFTTIRVGDFGVRVATTHIEDGPVMWSWLLADPSRFRGDIIETYGVAWALASIANWLPAFLLKFAGVPPELPSLLLVYIQNVGMALSVWWLARTVTSRVDVAVLSALFALAIEPWRLNAANINRVMTIPYPHELAVVALVVAFTFALKRRELAAGLLVALSVLIHPSVGVIALTMLAAFWGSEVFSTDRRTLGVRAGVLALGGAVVLVQAAVLLPGSDLTAADMYDILAYGAHTSPWRYFTAWYIRAFTLAGMATIGFLALRYRSRWQGPFVRLWLSCFAVFIVFGALQVIGVVALIPRLGQLLGLRSLGLVVVLALPVLVLYLREAMASRRLIARWATATIMLGLGALGWGAYWPLLVVLVCTDLLDSRLGPWRVQLPPAATRLITIGSGAALASFALLLVFAQACSPTNGPLTSRPCAWAGLLAGPLGESDRFLISLFALLVAGAVALAATIRPSRRIAVTQGIAPLTAMLAVLLVAKGLEARAETTEPRAVALREAQTWTREHTAEDAVFLLHDLPWRAVSLRRVVDARIGYLYNYSGTAATKRYDDEFMRFYGLDPAAHPPPEVVHPTAEARFRALDDDGVRRLAEQFGGDYVVREARDAKLGLPEVYRNGGFVIYRITAA
jgi:hypothetical protein